MRQAVSGPRQSETQQFPSVHEVSGRLLQRACACGNHTRGAGECESCRKKRMSLQRSSIGHPGDLAGIAAPPIVHDVPSELGGLLDSESREFTEHRFGRVPLNPDAVRAVSVRAHTDTQTADGKLSQ